jgi:hypothetical protein
MQKSAGTATVPTFIGMGDNMKNYLYGTMALAAVGLKTSQVDPKKTRRWRPRSSLGGDSIQAYSGGKIYSGGNSD